MPGHNHGSSIKRPKVYEALRKKYSKAKSAAISNSMAGKGKGKGKGKKKR